MKKFYEEPIVETTIIMDVVSDEMDTPDEGSGGTKSDGVL